MKDKKWTGWLALHLASAMALMSPWLAQATLYDRGNGLIYDSALNITWLQDVTFARTSGKDSDGLFAWSDAQTWVGQLNYNGITGWRLPTLSPVGGGQFFNFTLSLNGSTDYAYNLGYPGRTNPFDAASQSAGFKGNELAYMFFVDLNNLATVKTDGTGRSGVYGVNYGPANASFIDGTTGQTRSFLHYGVGMENFWTRYPGSSTYTFMFVGTGFNDAANKSALAGAWAVHDGDVAVAVPEPAAWRSMLVGLLLMTLLWAQRIRRASPVLRG